MARQRRLFNIQIFQNFAHRQIAFLQNRNNFSPVNISQRFKYLVHYWIISIILDISSPCKISLSLSQYLSMTNLNFPIESTKVPGVTQSFDLADPGQRQLYFKLKVGKEIEKVKTFLEDHTFVAIMLGKKGSGKGTYSGLLKEVFGDDHIGQISVGDITRSVFDEIKTPEGMANLKESVQKTIEDIFPLTKLSISLSIRPKVNYYPPNLFFPLLLVKLKNCPKKL